jgi:hypothetical protein
MLRISLTQALRHLAVRNSGGTKAGVGGFKAPRSGYSLLVEITLA